MNGDVTDMCKFPSKGMLPVAAMQASKRRRNSRGTGGGAMLENGRVNNPKAHCEGQRA